jgi:hypothetical protein
MRPRRRRRAMRRLAAASVLCAVALAVAGGARGERVCQGNLCLSFDGRFRPHALPRDRSVPVNVSLDGSISTTDGSGPPRLRSISIAVNRHGRVSTRGLPVCLPARLEQTSSATALSRCRAALVGHGRFEAGIESAGRPPFPVEGQMLAFNSRVGGRTAILMHIYGSRPIRASVVLVFRISHPRRGEFGTVLSTTIPKIASDAGYVTGISLSFGRRYRYRGMARSFLSASCDAPDGFPGAIFNFARGSFGFENGQTVPITLTRDCLVRR